MCTIIFNSIEDNIYPITKIILKFNMSQNKNVVSEIKGLMVKFGFMSPEEDKKDDYIKLIDGTEIRVEGELAEGSAVLAVTEEGDIPVPDAIHELEDGTKVTTEGGIIKSIEIKEESEEIEEEKEEVKIEAEEEVIEEKVEEKKEILEEVIEDKKEEIVEKLEEEEIEIPEEKKEDISEKIVEVIIPVLEKVKQLEEELKKVNASFNAFKNEAAGKPVNKSKKDFSKTTDVVVERILQMKNNR